MYLVFISTWLLVYILWQYYRTVPLLLNGGSFSKASAPPLFLEDENIFQKSASVVALEIALEVQPRRPIFEKSSHLREKGGVLMLFKTTRHL